jgi:lipoprotein-releasing system permease protein
MRTLFSLVYLVCAGLVLSIFWAIVYEKTRDIGILRSIGASRLGISWIFLRYGLVVGVAGAIVGLGLAWLIVRNINNIHTALGDPPLLLAFITGAIALIALVVTALRGRSGRLLPLVLGTLITITLAAITALILWVQQAGGVVIWDPSVYYFTEIPSKMDFVSAAITMVGAVVFSLIGAFLPAAKAADTDPVRALRYE